MYELKPEMTLKLTVNWLGTQTHELRLLVGSDGRRWIDRGIDYMPAPTSELGGQGYDTFSEAPVLEAEIIYEKQTADTTDVQRKEFYLKFNDNIFATGQAVAYYGVINAVGINQLLPAPIVPIAEFDPKDYKVVMNLEKK